MQKEHSPWFGCFFPGISLPGYFRTAFPFSGKAKIPLIQFISAPRNNLHPIFMAGKLKSRIQDSFFFSFSIILQGKDFHFKVSIGLPALNEG